MIVKLSYGQSAKGDKSSPGLLNPIHFAPISQKATYNSGHGMALNVFHIILLLVKLRMFSLESWLFADMMPMELLSWSNKAKQTFVQ